MKLVFFLEEPSAREMLQALHSMLAPDSHWQFIVFEGKQDLEKNLPRKLKAWLPDAETCFIVMRDQDSGDCKVIKDRLYNLCPQAVKSKTLIRIACHELESFYLGDLAAVEQAFPGSKVNRQQNAKKFRAPDNLANAAEELKKLIPNYQKVSGSRKISRHLSMHNNKSHSFNVLIEGISRLLVS